MHLAQERYKKTKIVIPVMSRAGMESKLKYNGSSIIHLEDYGINVFLSKLHSQENFKLFYSNTCFTH